MRPHVALWLALASLVSACQGLLVVPDGAFEGRGPNAGKPQAGTLGGPARPAGATPSAPATASPAPGGRETPGAVRPGAAALATLVRPKAGVIVLKGTVAIDARAAIEAGQATVAEEGGRAYVAVGKGQILSHNGAMVVAPLVGQGGGSLVGQGGHNLVTQGGQTYWLAQAVTSPGPQALDGPVGLSSPAKLERTAVGRVLPAAGMHLAVRDLRTGKPVSLGLDGAGQDVFTIVTPSSGAFEVYLPADLKGNVRVEARVPDSADPALSYGVVTQPGAGETAIDEDSALVSRFLAESWRGRMGDLLRELAKQPPASDDQVLKTLYGRSLTLNFQTMAMVLKPLLGEVRAAIARAPFPDDAARLATAARAADAVLGHADFDGLAAHATPEFAKYLQADERAIGVLVAAVRQVRDRATAHMQAAEAKGAPAAFLAATPFVGAGVRIKKPADVPAYVVAEAFTQEEDIQKLRALPYFEALGLTREEAITLLARIYSANAAAGEHLGLLLASDAGVKADMLAAMK